MKKNTLSLITIICGYGLIFYVLFFMKYNDLGFNLMIIISCISFILLMWFINYLFILKEITKENQEPFGITITDPLKPKITLDQEDFNSVLYGDDKKEFERIKNEFILNELPSNEGLLILNEGSIQDSEVSKFDDRVYNETIYNPENHQKMKYLKPEPFFAKDQEIKTHSNFPEGSLTKHLQNTDKMIDQENKEKQLHQMMKSIKDLLDLNPDEFEKAMQMFDKMKEEESDPVKLMDSYFESWKNNEKNGHNKI